MSTCKLSKMAILFLFGFFVVTPIWASELDQPTNGTTYEKHVGIFASKPRETANEPLLGSGERVTKHFFSVMGKADHLLGRTLHTKTYSEENKDSFVTLEQEGAKMGYDF